MKTFALLGARLERRRPLAPVGDFWFVLLLPALPARLLLLAGGAFTHSFSMPAASMIFFHLSDSAAWNLRRSSEEPPSASKPFWA